LLFQGNLVASLRDPDRLSAYSDALRNWEVSGYVRFELTEEAYRWVRRELNGVPLKDIGRIMFEHVASGGEIDEIVESRAEWRDLHEFHHDLRIPIQGKLVYVETRLNFRPPFVADESPIIVVNIHEC